ncbi:hypothetical protein C8Q77DRAFT_1080729 [Trametes polyzona]|nr:hypothetical protein C8Q77DRAFT_1080729 [Trametes polyzona]
MASPSSYSSRRMPPTPFFPGAWPNTSQETTDPDASSASYPAVSDSRSDHVPNDRVQRRWTYAGRGTPQTNTFSIPAPASPDFAPLAASTSQGSRMSGLTDNTLSSAASSALNTPELARWSTLPTGGDGTRSRAESGADGVIEGSPNSFTSGNGAMGPRYIAGVPLSKQTSSPLMRDHFGSPYLDAPLLNIVPGLPPLKLPPLPAFPPTVESPPAPPSPLSEACPTPPSFNIPSPGGEYPPSSSHSPAAPSSCIAMDFFPVAEVTPEPSPQLTIASLSSGMHNHDADSLVLPPFESDNAHIVGVGPSAFTHTSPSASQMDAFALAAAVAASPSRSSLSIPPSFQSAYGTSIIPDVSSCPIQDLPRPSAHRQPSCLTQASTGHWTRRAHDPRSEREVDESYDLPASPTIDHMDRVMRRRSAPVPAARQSPRPTASKTISSRVDVGERALPRKGRSTKPPVLGKVRKIGQRIRGLFKGKNSSPVKTKGPAIGATGPVPEYGLMTTTTAVTNIEYESEHPIPAPSPRAKMLRNHRRSLPLPSLLLPSSADNVASAIFKRPSASRSNSSRGRDGVSAFSETDEDRNDDHTRTPTHSPQTPRPQRQRTRTAPQAEDRTSATPDERKGRRFSLSSALSKSRLETLRATVMPRPPLPPMPSHLSCDNPSLVVHLQDVPRSSPPMYHASGFWGEELPSVQITRGSEDIRPVAESPRRMRTQTAPSAPQSEPAEIEPLTTTPKARRLRRFSLSSMMARRASRSRVATTGSSGRPSVPPSPNIPPVPTRATTEQYFRRPRGDTITTITQGVPFDLVQPKPTPNIHSPSTPLTEHPNRYSLASTLSSGHAGSAYFDAREQLSEDVHRSSFDADRSCSPGPESDLDSMSFARTPDYSSATFSFWSGGERDRYPDADALSIPGSYHFRPSLVGRCASTSAVSQLVTENTSTPVVKTLRFSPSLSLSFERSWSNDDDEDEVGIMEREEERGFMRALGFEFDEIARRVREEPL